MPTVYPNSAGAATAAPCDFFSPLPRTVWALIEQRRITRRDAAVLGVLLDYKNQNSTIVGPGQESLARRLACSLDTLQRSLSRLAAVGLIVKKYLRDRTGRLRGLTYDLANVLDMMPTKTAKLRHGDWGQGSDTVRPSPSKNRPVRSQSPKPQNCGIEVESESVAEADNTTPLSPTERDLSQAGVVPKVARRLVQKFGEDVCRRYLAAFATRPKATNPAGLIVAGITQGWTIPNAPRTASRAPSPLRFGPARVMAAAPPPDPLDGLSPPEAAALEAKARAALKAELPVLRKRFDEDRGAAVVRQRMRDLLARTEAATGGPA